MRQKKEAHLSFGVGHKLQRLQEIVALRLTWAETVAQIERMRTWVVEAETILAAEWATPQTPVTADTVGSRFDAWLDHLQQRLGDPLLTPDELRCLQHFVAVTDRLRPHLLLCYAVAGLPRTNNDMERYIRSLKTRYRRVSGRKNGNAYMVRYGASVAYFDWRLQAGTGIDAVTHLLFTVDRHAWRKARLHMRARGRDQILMYRFRHDRATYLTVLETTWPSSPTSTGLLP